MKIFPNNLETRINIKKNEEFMMTHQKQNRNNFVTSNTNTNNYTITNNNNITNSGLINRNKDIFVESLVDTTATIIETIWCNFPVVTTAQIIPLRLFIKETLKRSRTFLSTLKIAQLYLLRIQLKINSLHSSITTATTTFNNNNNNCNNNNIYGPSSSLSDNKNIDPATCGRRMFLASLIVASKYLQDKNYSNTAWSKICGLQVKEINMVERRFLQLICYNLYVSEELFDNWTNFLNSNLLNIKLSSFDYNSNNNNNNGGGKNYNNNNIHDNNNNSNCMNFQASNNNNNNVISSMNVVQTNSSNMDAHSFENPNLSTVLTASPMIIMSRSKECHVRG